MTKKELIKLDESLSSFSNMAKILEDKRGFYFYYNKPNKEEKPIKIHQHYCGECKWGSGKITNKEVGLNGAWIGPFSKTEQIEAFIKDNFPNLKDKIDKNCGCLK